MHSIAVFAKPRAASATRSQTTRVLTAVAIVAGAIILTAWPATSPGQPLQTKVSISGNRFMINGALTHRGTTLEGLLPNSRMVQATFDDENFSTVSNWRYPDTGTWDPERNLREFIAALPAYRNAGLLAVTLNFQGGGPVANQFVTGQPWINSAFDSNGNLKSAYLSRLDRAIRALDAQGMVAIVGLFYFGQANRLAGDAAIFNATDKATDWLLAQGYTNVLIEVCNEAGNGYVQPALQPSQISTLIQRIKSRAGSRLPVSTSFLAGHVPSASVLQASDYVLLHGNDLSASALQSYIRSIKQLTTKPLIVNEDSTNVSNWDVAVSEGVSWGYYDQGANNYRDGFQSPPVNWGIQTPAKQLFFGRITSSSSSATGGTPAVLGFTLINADTDQPVAGYDPITEGAIIHLPSLPTANLALRANTQPGLVGSVRLQLDSAGSRLENTAPYAVCGDTGGDYSPCTLAVGNHSVGATPYSLPNGGGTAGSAKITRFEISNTISSSPSPTPSPTPQPGSTPAVVGFTLINANTDQPVAGYDPIPEGAIINLASLPTANLALRANTLPGVVGSVAMQLNSAGSRLENMAPYAVCGDTGGDYSPCALAVGNHAVAATPYSLANGGGTAGSSKITRFEISSTASPSPSPVPAPSPTPTPTPQPPAVLGFTLINANTDQPVGGYDPIPEGAIIDLTSLPTANLALRANTQPGVVGSVRLQLDSTGSRLENTAPYAVCGDTGGDYSPCTLAVGNHSVAATPYSLANGGGTAGSAKITRFEIRSTANPSPSPVPAPSPTPQPVTMVFPGPSWEIATPESQNVDSALLQNALTYLASQMDISEAAVIRNGRMIWNGGNLNYRHTVWSTTKSFTSTVLGLLIGDGKATLGTRASSSVPELVSSYNGVTLRHFATMSSGYDAVGGSYDPIDGSYVWWTPETPMFAPGAQFAYSDDAMNEFGYVMTKIAGENLADLFRRRIADLIGMSNWNWEGFPLGNFFVNNTSGNFEGMQMSASDAARFGHLFLNRGNWAGRQLLSASWVDQATTVQVPANVPNSGFRGIDGAGMYGFNWWVNGIKPNGQRKWPSAPPKTYTSHGLNQNVISVFPEWNLVFVRQGTSAEANDAIWNTFYGKLGAAMR